MILPMMAGSELDNLISGGTGGAFFRQKKTPAAASASTQTMMPKRRRRVGRRFPEPAARDFCWGLATAANNKRTAPRKQSIWNRLVAARRWGEIPSKPSTPSEQSNFARQIRQSFAPLGCLPDARPQSELRGTRSGHECQEQICDKQHEMHCPLHHVSATGAERDRTHQKRHRKQGHLLWRQTQDQRQF